MNKTIKATLIYLCFISNIAYAQQQDVATPDKKNIVKINLPALLFKNISLEYERALAKRTSLAVNVHFIPFGILPFQNIFKNITDNSDVKYEQFKLGSFGVVPQFRYYVGKKGALHGFYIGPFISYANYKINLPISYSNDTKTGIFDGKLDAFTGGLQIGAQFKIGKNMSLDWWIFGPNYGSADGELNFSGTLSQVEQDELRRQLEDLKNDAPLKTIRSYSVSSTGASVVAKGPWGGLRGLGFSLGYRF